MRALVLSSDDSVGRSVHAALASEFEVVVSSQPAGAVVEGFDIVLIDKQLQLTQPTLVDLLKRDAAIIWIHRPDTAAQPSTAESSWPTAVISGNEPPTDQDIQTLRRTVIQSERIHTAQRLAWLERRMASVGMQLRAILDHTGANVFTVELPPQQGWAATDQWLLKSIGDRAGDVNANTHPADLPRLRQDVANYLDGVTNTFDVEFRLLGSSGQWEWIRQRAIVGTAHSDGSPQQIFVTVTSHTAQHRAESLLDRQAKIIEQLVSGDELEDVLIALIQTIEENYCNALAVVARLDEAARRLYHMAGPSLPDEYHAAFEGLAIGPGVGACGAAAFEGRRVVITDLLTDLSCQPYHEHFLRFGVRSVWSQPIFGSQGNILGTFAIYHRETHAPEPEEIRLIETAANLAGLAIERWRQIDSLLQNEKRFRQLADLARLFPWDYDVQQRRFNYVGPQVEKILGYTPAALAEPNYWTSLVHPDDLAELARRADHAERYGENFALEYRVIASDGRTVWLHGLFSVLLRGGKATRLQGFSLDITDRKLAEEALRESEERYRILAEFSTDMIGRLDATATFQYVSPACRSMLGYEPEELVGRSAFDLVHEDDLATVRAQWQALETQRDALGTYRIRRADGQYVWFETRGQQRAAKDGSGFEVIATSRDVTEQVESAKKLRQRELELAHAERLGTMGQMAAELAHELNQPLQAISNFAEAAMHWTEHPTDDLEPLKRWTGHISQQARRAGEVVRRILNFVRKGELDPASFDLTACVRGLQPLLDVAARSHGAKIDYQLATDLPEIVADRLLIEQVVVNLFRNALEAMLEKPADRRIVTLQTFQTEDRRIGLAVQDRGRGLDPEEAERLFEPYFTTKFDGTGMGLAICRSTIDAHQGRIWAENNEAGGATFRFLLPIEPSHSA